jgi:hypothetical protein
MLTSAKKAFLKKLTVRNFDLFTLHANVHKYPEKVNKPVYKKHHFFVDAR